jgi:conjugal transfer pilus assembly protein TraK
VGVINKPLITAFLTLAVVANIGTFAFAKEVDIDVNAVVVDDDDVQTAPTPPSTTRKYNPPTEKTDRADNTVKAEKTPTKTEESDLLPPETIQDDGIGGQIALPEITMRAKMSASDVNRVVCRQEIRDVVYSKEKDMVVKFSGKNAFIKFRVGRIGDDFKYPKDPVELFIICGDNTYNLIAIPKNVPSQTIRLDNGKVEKIAKNISTFQGQALEKKLVSLVKMALTDSIPDTFSVDTTNKQISVFADIGATLIKTVSVDGEGLVLKEFLLRPKIDIELLEKRFLVKEFAVRPLAVAFDRQKLRAGEVGKLFIVEAKDEQQQGGLSESR